MRKAKFSIKPAGVHIMLAILIVLLWETALNSRSVQAGSGPTITIPPSNLIPVMDGVCEPSEYADAAQITVTVGTSETFPVYMKHSKSDAYFCFGDDAGLPLPNGGDPAVTVYIDVEGDSLLGSDDFGVWMPYNPDGLPWSRTWVSSRHNYFGPDPGGWQAVKHQIEGSNPFWQAEFRISSQTMGGWDKTIGMAFFYHWWQGPSNDYSWPKNGVWAAPGDWGNGVLSTYSVDVGLSATGPAVDGLCGVEYSDASTLSFDTPNGTATAYLEHSLTDLYVCLNHLEVPTATQVLTSSAVVYIDRLGAGGQTPTESQVLFSTTYSGTVQVHTGDGAGFTGPDPGGHEIMVSRYTDGWDAEFRISGETIGDWWSRQIGLSLGQNGVPLPSIVYGWPAGFDVAVPDTWGVANLLDLDDPPITPTPPIPSTPPAIYLPLINHALDNGGG